MAEEKVLKRRRVPRRQILERVGVLVSGEYLLTYAYEIGEGGMLIESREPLTVGKRVVITLALPGVGQQVLKGIVRYEQPHDPSKDIPRYGVQFTDIGFDVRRKIRTFVASSSQKEDQASA